MANVKVFSDKQTNTQTGQKLYSQSSNKVTEDHRGITQNLY